MELPVGMLIYWVRLIEEDNAMLMGMWYYMEMYVPSTIEEKKHSSLDLKEKRCMALILTGTFDQIMDLLAQCDRFRDGGPNEIDQYSQLHNELRKLPKDKPYLFDDIYNLKGTSLILDTVVEVEETIDDIKEALKTGKAVFANISKNWSFAGELQKVFQG